MSSIFPSCCYAQYHSATFMIQFRPDLFMSAVLIKDVKTSPRYFLPPRFWLSNVPNQCFIVRKQITLTGRHDQPSIYLVMVHRASPLGGILALGIQGMFWYLMLLCNVWFCCVRVTRWCISSLQSNKLFGVYQVFYSVDLFYNGFFGRIM